MLHLAAAPSGCLHPPAQHPQHPKPGSYPVPTLTLKPPYRKAFLCRPTPPRPHGSHSHRGRPGTTYEKKLTWPTQHASAPLWSSDIFYKFIISSTKTIISQQKVIIISIEIHQLICRTPKGFTGANISNSCCAITSCVVCMQ